MIDIEGGMVMAEKEMQVLERIARQMADIPGHTGFYYKNLITGCEFSVRADLPTTIHMPCFH